MTNVDFILKRKCSDDGITLTIETTHNILRSYLCKSVEEYYVTLAGIRSDLEAEFKIKREYIESAISRCVDITSLDGISGTSLSALVFR